MKQLIYLAEDDDNIRELVGYALASYGYEVQSFTQGDTLLTQIARRQPDLVVLDIMMPVMDGLETLRHLRTAEQTRNLPVIMLTAKAGEVDKVKGLDLGADDYVVKPFSLLEFNARVRAMLRRGEQAVSGEKTVLCVGGIRLDTEKYEARLDDEPLELTYKEFELLKTLMRNAGRVLTREELLNEVWGYDYIGETRTLDMHIKTLRAKIMDSAENPRYIKTVRSVGYKFSES